jgi:predicted DNA-binding transcriptional regulator YafY
MSRTLRRYLTMMRHIPVRGAGGGAGIDTERLLGVLAGADLAVSKRTLQRDLEALALEFPELRCSEKTKPYGWYWHGDGPPLGTPLLGLTSALVHDLVQRHLVAALPRALVKGLKPSFDRARQMLTESGDARLSHWSRSVRALPAGYPRQPPEVRGPVLEVVYEALYLGQRFEADYRKNGGAERGTYEVSPLGLVLRSGIVTLVCTFWDYAEVNHLSLHRIQSARSTERRVKPPPGFQLDEHIRSGQLGFLVGPPLTLKARVQAAIAERLEDMPIDKDQRLSAARDGWCSLEARVNDSMELRGWLRSLGPLIEVLGPKKLREAMTEDAAALPALPIGTVARTAHAWHRTAARQRPRRSERRQQPAETFRTPRSVAPTSPAPARGHVRSWAQPVARSASCGGDAPQRARS